MRTCLLLFVCFALTSCYWEVAPDEKYDIPKNYRNLYNCYKVGDTLIFKSSTNLVDSFVISGIDSVIVSRKGLYTNGRNLKNVSVYYRQIPVDYWHSRWTEIEPETQQERSRDAELISVVKYPDSETTEYYCDFKDFGCYRSDTLKLRTKTILLNDYKLTNYYRIGNNCDITIGNLPENIDVCYFTVHEGLVAFETNNGVCWTRQN